MVSSYFADFHIHIGRDFNGKPVKITGAKSLTLSNIVRESAETKGLDMIGIIDCHVPAVQQEMRQLIEKGEGTELDQGGIRFGRTTVLTGSEIELYDSHAKGPIHVLVFFPALQEMETFTDWLRDKMTNINLSSQRFYGESITLQQKVIELGGLFIPAHVFTPFKSLFGKGVTSSLKEVFDPNLLDGIELGLSSDTTMASRIKELGRYPFLSNSDAHSLPKIAREYNQLLLEEPSFLEFKKALKNEDGRKIQRNYGLDPLLGKYHSTVCLQCGGITKSTAACENCGSHKVVKGVAERIEELADIANPEWDHPPYIHQVPLEYLPSLGPKTFKKLLNRFGTEMAVLHDASFEELEEVVGRKLALAIIQMRTGKLPILSGGGGKYGKISLE